MRDRICDYCGRQYSPSNYNQRFCGSSCKNCSSSSLRIRASETSKSSMESIYEVNFSSVDGKTIDHLVNWGELLEKVFDAGVETRLILEPDDYQLLHKLRMEKKKRDLEKSYK